MSEPEYRRSTLRKEGRRRIELEVRTMRAQETVEVLTKTGASIGSRTEEVCPADLTALQGTILRKIHTVQTDARAGARI